MEIAKLIITILGFLLSGCTLGISVDRIPQQGGETGFRHIRTTPETLGYRESKPLRFAKRS